MEVDVKGKLRPYYCASQHAMPLELQEKLVMSSLDMDLSDQMTQ
jgi:hypothetical protein